MSNEPVPYRIYISEETIKKLNKAATDTGRDSGNKVAADMVNTLLPVWLALQKSLGSHREDFVRQVVAEIEQGKQKR